MGASEIEPQKGYHIDCTGGTSEKTYYSGT